MAEKTVKTRIKLIRNSIANLEQDNPLTLHGELYICDESASNGLIKLKFGQENKYFNDLRYYEQDLLESLGIVITNPQSNQILVFDGTNWVNKELFNGASFVYETAGLNIKGQEDAKQGYMLVKDNTTGVAWVKPVSTEQLDAAVAAATAQAQLAGQYATNAGSSASEAATSASQAAASVTTIQEWIGKKFWWGTLEEYNALSAVYDGTFYFIMSE